MPLSNGRYHPAALRILLVDNEPGVLKAVTDLTQSLGYEVVAFKDSLEAAECVNLQKFDGAIVSTSTPYMNGFVLVRFIRFSTSNSSVPSVMVSRAADAQTMRKPFEAGATFFVSKPIDAKKLQGVLSVMHGQMLKEKRSYVRVPIQIPVVCSAEGNQFQCRSVNVSLRGILLEISGGPEVGQAIEVQFTLPSGEARLSPSASIVRKEPRGRMALQFTVLGADDHWALESYIAGLV